MAEGGRSSGPGTRDSSTLDSSAPASPLKAAMLSELHHKSMLIPRKGSIVREVRERMNQRRSVRVTGIILDNRKLI